jgi:hypothetical protein
MISHARWDRVIALILLVSPWLFGLSHISAARNLFVALGAALAIYSRSRAIPPGIHNVCDVFVGFFLMIGPYFYQYRSSISASQALLHFAIGFGIWGLVLFTGPGPESQKEKLPTDLSELRKEAFKRSA